MQVYTIDERKFPAAVILNIFPVDLLELNKYQKTRTRRVFVVKHTSFEVKPQPHELSSVKFCRLGIELVSY